MGRQRQALAVKRFRSIFEFCPGLGSGQFCFDPTFVPRSPQESSTPPAASFILVVRIMPTRQSKSGDSAGTAVMEAPNGQRERVLDLYRQWGYLEADLDPLGFL